jgi:signal transduction histidine kinase
MSFGNERIHRLMSFISESGLEDFREWVAKGGRPEERKGHFWIILCLFVALTVLYYLDHLLAISGRSQGIGFFGGVHDLHRTFVLVPIIYAALVFRLSGCLIASVAFLCIVLPRAFYVSPYPNPLLRPLISVVSSFLIGALVAAWRTRLEVESRDKERLAAAYEEVTHYSKRLEENQEMLIQAEKLASMGQLAASIAHEVNNPLTGVLVYVQLIRKKLAKGNLQTEILQDYLSRIEFEVTRSAKLVRNLLDFSSQSKPNIQQTDCNEVLMRALDLAIHARSGNADVQTHLGQLPKIMADPEQLQEVLINLIVNAFQAMPSGGTLTIRTEVGEQEVRMAVRDTGCGIPPENMGKLFTPFFSTKKDVKGVGLGLPVSYGIVQRLSGRIDVESAVGEGSTFTVCIPIGGNE